MRFIAVATIALLASCGGSDSGDAGAADLTLRDQGGVPDSLPPDMNPCPYLNLSSGQPSDPHCASEGSVCNYFEARLVCRGGTWDYCSDPFPLQCPGTPPEDSKDCGGRCTSLACPYACIGGKTKTCTCMLNRWSCSMVACVPDGGGGDAG